MIEGFPEAQQDDTPEALKDLRGEIETQAQTIERMGQDLAKKINATIAQDEMLNESNPIPWQTNDAPSLKPNQDVPQAIINAAKKHFRQDISQNYEFTSFTRRQGRTVIIRLTFYLKKKSPNSKAE